MKRASWALRYRCVLTENTEILGFMCSCQVTCLVRWCIISVINLPVDCQHHSSSIQHAFLFVLASVVAQEQDGRVMSQSHLNCGSWSLAGFSLQSDPGLKLCLQKACVPHWSLYLFHSLTHSPSSSHLSHTSSYLLYFLFLSLSSLALSLSLPPSTADIWVAFRNQPGTVNTGRREERPYTLTMCQHCYFLHHRTRLDTNNGMHWQSFRKTARGKWANANPRLCKSIRSRLSLEI